MSTPPAAPLRIALVGDHDPHITAHRAIPLALRLAGEALGLEIAFDWLASDRLPAEPALERYDGFWCVPGSPYRDADAVLRLIAHARGRRRPFLGTCAGFQHTILEFARNALGWQAATHGEEHPHSDQAVIAALPCALLEAREEVRLLRGSRLALAYAADWIEADYHCRYAIAPRFAAELTGGALRASAWSADGAIRAVELEQHPFFVATLFQPERAALAGVLPPLPKAFVEACRTQRRDRPRRGPTPYYAVIFSSHRSAVDDGYAIEKKELPLVVGILADLSGKPDTPPAKLVERRFVDIDRDNFNEILSSISPRATLQVDNTISGDDSKLNVELRFNHIEDFDPVNLVKQVVPLRRLFEARQRLRDLLTKLDGNDDLDQLLQDVVANTEGLQEIKAARPEAEAAPAGDSEPPADQPA